MEQSTTYQRLIRLMIYAACMLLCISVMGKIIGYFKTGADITSSLHLTEEKLSEHTPITSWLPDDPLNPTPTDDFIKSEISKAYVNAWQAISLSKQDHYKLALDDFFTDSLEYHISRNNFVNPNLESIDIAHRLQLHLLSFDRQFVSFTDTAKIVERFKTKTRHVVREYETTYQVIMTFEDGRWKVREMELNEKRLIADQASKTIKITLPENGINYYPSKTPWDLFWTEYQDSIIERDLNHIKSLNFESVRIFIPFENFGKGHIDYQKLEHLNHFLDASYENDLKVIITLFDMPLGFELSKYPMYLSQMKSLVDKVADHPALLAWDLKNEPDLDYNHHERKVVNDWLAFMLKYLKKTDQENPVTIGWSKYQFACNLSSKLDFVSFHFYDRPELLTNQIQELRTCVKEKKIMISEYGRSSAKSAFGSNEIQAAYNAQVLEIAKTSNVNSNYLWCYSDYAHTPSNVFGRNPLTKWKQQKFGIVDIEGNLKK